MVTLPSALKFSTAALPFGSSTFPDLAHQLALDLLRTYGHQILGHHGTGA